MAISLGVAGGPAQARPSASADASALKLYILDCGVLLYNNVSRFGYKPGEIKPTNLSDACYLVVHPTKGTLVWDTGAVPDGMWGSDGFPPKKLYAEGTKPLGKQLSELGYPADKVSFVAVSHAHWDHVANLAEFKNSTWVAQKYTVDKLTGSDVPDKTDPAMFKGVKDFKTAIMPDGQTFDVFGDGSAVIVPAPGHTPDSRALVVRLKKYGPVILAGDVWHFVKDETTNNTLPGEDRDQNLHSRAELIAMSKSIGAKIWIPHDMPQFTALTHARKVYE